MSVDLSAILDLAAPFAAAAVDTSGTTVDIRRPGPDGTLTIDPDTLTVTDASSRVLTGLAAIIIAVSDTGQPLGPARTWEATRYRVLLQPDTVGMLPGDIVLVTDSRDPMLIKRQLRISEVIADSPGVLRILDATLVGAGA